MKNIIKRIGDYFGWDEVDRKFLPIVFILFLIAFVLLIMTALK